MERRKASLPELKYKKGMPLLGDERPSPQAGRPDCGLLMRSDCAAGKGSDSCATTPTTDRNQLPYSHLRRGGDTSTSSSVLSADGVVVEDGTVRVKQRLGLFSGTALIVGSMIGSGIFISPKGVIAGTGSVAASLIVWVACGIISLFGVVGCEPQNPSSTAAAMANAQLNTRVGCVGWLIVHQPSLSINLFSRLLIGWQAGVGVAGAAASFLVGQSLEAV